MRSAVSMKDYKNISRDEFEDLIDIQITEAPVFYHNDEMVCEGDDPQYESYDARKFLLADGKPVSIVGKHFNYVQPKEHILRTLDVLTENEIEYEPRQLHVMRNGAHIMAVLDLPQFKMFAGTEEEQQAQFVYQFGYTGAHSDFGLLGALRGFCTNGSISMGEGGMEYRLKHRGDMIAKAEKAVDMYKSFDESWQKTIEEIKLLSILNADKDKLKFYIGNGEISGQGIFKGERWAKRLLEEWKSLNEPVNFWTLYNMFTYLISHEYGSNHSSKVTKMMLLNREVKNWNQLL